ncbi:hypothetical protein PRZ48_012726 [Zasmidium cellare]|uniref:Mannosyl phosphorylinositol ceramide synthase SUR1 n=1 Tax=Zasmidium cellare TaxID=395010 RepID=A0ABR0E5N3_ZASCE|nr:hypothetical protein PRZ48_012726 [Zasmidium cellare]
MPARRGPRFWLATIVGVLCALYLILRIVSFVHIFGQHEGVVLTQDEVLEAYQSQKPLEHRTAYVPRIIHQIFHNWTDPDNEALPSQWNENRKSCVDLNPGWESWLWTPKTSREFIEREYPWFLTTYDNFKFLIQRIDSLRYFLLRHYGGIYMDADNGCKTSLEPLRYYPAWVVDGGHGALSNDILAGEPEHAYWILMTDSLISYAWNYPLPYITISYATGQWYETEIWNKYFRQKVDDKPEPVRILTDGRPGAAEPVFFTYSGGETWHNWDNQMFGWIGQNLLFFIAIVAGNAVVLSMACVAVAYRLNRWLGRDQRLVKY